MSTPFQNCRIVGENVSVETYMHAVDADGKASKRGDPHFPMTRGALMNFAECPHRWLAGYDRADTDATDWGSLIDTLALTPNMFASRYAIAPAEYPGTPKKKGDPAVMKPWRYGSDYCDEWKSVQEKAGRTVVKNTEYGAAADALKALRADSQIAELIDCSRKQVMIVGEYVDRETGIVIPVRALLDLVPDADHPTFGRCLADLKTSATANPSIWVKFCFQRGYDVQAAFYLDLFVAATGGDRTDWLHAIQENYPPWETGKRLLSASFVDIGRARYRNALARYCRCLKSDKWPGYDADGVMDDWTLTEPELWMESAAMRTTRPLELSEETETPPDETDVGH